MSPDVSTAPDCEQPLRQTGWGLYHYFMIGMASACAFAQATALTSLPFAVPLAICDVGISDKTLTTINVCFSFGMAFGGFFLTSASDISGRKCMIPLSLMVIFGSTFACGFAHGSLMILVCVFTLGCGIASNASCAKIHLAEILPPEKRGFYLVVPDMFWSLGYIISTLMAWLLTPSIIHHQKMDMRLATWRLMFGLSGICGIMVACASALIQPSPRFLLFRKRYPEALDTLKHMYAVNSSRHCETYQQLTCEENNIQFVSAYEYSETTVADDETVHPEDLEGCVDDFSLNNEPTPTNCTEQIMTALRRIQKLASHLIKKRFLRATALLISMKFAVLLGILAINIWLAKMLEYGNKSDCYFTAVDILHLEGSSNKCKFNLSTSIYRDFFIIALNILIGQAILLLLIDRIGRRISIIGGCVACGASSFALGYIHNIYAVQMAVSSVFMMAYSLVDSVLNIVVIEAYPTAFRGTAVGGTQFFARFAGAFAKRFLQTPCQYSFIFIGALMLAAAALGYFLPELRGEAMVE